MVRRSIDRTYFNLPSGSPGLNCIGATLNTYNLSALDDKEFEAMAVDLLGEEFGTRIERFKPGKDEGVDGRWFTNEKREIIIQCKHWIRSGTSALVKHVAAKEKPKIDRLKPARYILFTSVELSRHNKQSIAKKLSPHVISESDIFGSDDIHDLLGRHPEVEKRHYKLWLTSAAALSHVFNSAISGRSQFNEARIRAKMRLLVKTDDFEKAKEMLSRRHVVIITGAPGIGKTTLAEQMIIDSVASGFELVSIEQDVSEAESVYSKQRKQIFYFDDFLGRNLLEALSLKYDSHIIGFINRVRHDKTKRFILTSRSNILNQAKHLTDLFDIEKVDKNEYEIRIEHLSRLDKARILYSHIWHSDLPDATLEELFKEKRYRAVADHRNFKPRLVAFITDNEKAGVHDATGYWDYVTNTLTNPQDIWGHFFAAQLDQDCRDLVYLVVIHGKPILESVLMSAFRKTHSDGCLEGEVEHRAYVASKICTGSVLTRRLSGTGSRVEYELYDPSIADYVFRAVKEWEAFRRYFAALRTTSSLDTLGHMSFANVMPRESHLVILMYLADAEVERGAAIPDAYMVELCSKLIDNYECAARYKELLRGVADSVDYEAHADRALELVHIITHCLERRLIGNRFGRAMELLGFLETWPFSCSEFSLLLKIIAEFTDAERVTIERAANRCVLAYWEENIRDFIDREDLLTDVYLEDDFPRAIVELSASIAGALKGTGFSLSEGETKAICELIDLEGIAERNRDSSGGGESVIARTPPEKEVEDQLIDDLFEKTGR